MARDNYIAGIDVGSHSVKTVIAAFNNGLPMPQIVGLGQVPSAGIRKGIIIDFEEAAKAIGSSFKQAQENAGVQLRSAYVSIGGDHIASMPSRGTVAVGRVDLQISPDDLERVIANAATVALPANQEILHNIPNEFIIDGEGGFRDVIGMNGMRLEVNTTILRGSSAHIKTVNRCLEENEIEVDGYVLSPLAASKAVLSKRQRELGVVCIDIGGGTTDVAVFEEGHLIHTNVLPIGGGNITNDIAIGLRVGVDTAEKIKCEYGVARANELVKNQDYIDLSQFDPNEKETVRRRDVVNIMEARLNEIFTLVNKELKQIGKEKYLPGGAVIVGGCAKIPHIVDVCKDKLLITAQIGFPKDVEGIAASVDDPSYAVVLGTIFWAMESDNHSGGAFAVPYVSNLGNSAARIKKWLRSLLP
jgi:cell division protein FtsA